jgi:hypothetical protein
VKELNPSKRYSKEIAEKEGKSLAIDVSEAFLKKYPKIEQMVNAMEVFGEEARKFGVEIDNCKECRISYSKGIIDGFCCKHEEIGKRFQQKIEEALRE